MLDVSTDFDCGNVGAWSADGPNGLSFEAPTDGAPWAMWFYFRLEGAAPGRFRFTVSNLSECLEATHWGDAKPVMRQPGGEWVRARDGDVALDLANGAFRFHFDLPGGPVEVAYCYPYPPALLQNLFEHLQQFPGVEISYPGKTANGRPVPYLVMRCLDARCDPEVIWANGREHAGEVSGAYVLDGFLRAVVSSPLRNRYEIHALPMVDLDAVIEGRYGKCAPPIDHYMSWCPDTPRPEVALAMQLMEASAAKAKRFRLFLDFHSPSPESDSYLPPLNPTVLTPAQQANVARLHNAIVTCSPPAFPISADDMAYQRVSSWFADDAEHRPESYVLNRFGAESCLIETTYHASATGTPSSLQRFRALGAAITQALDKYLLNDLPGRIGVYDSMPPVFFNNHGWVLWSVPRYARMKFQSSSAWGVADSPQSSAYIGMPQCYRVGDIQKIRVCHRDGGQIEVVWCCYTDQGVRLLETPPAQPIESGPQWQPLTVPSNLPANTRRLRPSFRLSGAFRPFEVKFC